MSGFAQSSAEYQRRLGLRAAEAAERADAARRAEAARRRAEAAAAFRTDAQAAATATGPVRSSAEYKRRLAGGQR